MGKITCETCGDDFTQSDYLAMKPEHLKLECCFCRSISTLDETTYGFETCDNCQQPDACIDFNECWNKSHGISGNRGMLYVLVCALVACLVGCTDPSSTQFNDNSTSSRISPVEIRAINGHNYLIIKVDSTEYLTGSDGGFIRISN